ncbi:MAG: type II secretion system protein [Akkermansiaceae bacterium]|nr:type II secretion system protein [Akkermansiaceae bacterium]
MQQAGCHKRGTQAGGFTLLEIVFVLGMVAVLATWLTLSVTTVQTEQRLREASGSIETLAKQARNIAVRQQRAYQLTITEEAVSIAPQFTSISDGEHLIEPEENEEPAPRDDFEDITTREETDAEVTYEIKRWRSDEWQLIKGDTKVVITLDPVGLVEPISIRCSIGKSWLIHELHPLTAGIRDEEMSIEDD